MRATILICIYVNWKVRHQISKFSSPDEKGPDIQANSFSVQEFAPMSLKRLWEVIYGGEHAYPVEEDHPG